MYADDFLAAKLQKRQQQQALRSLYVPNAPMVDFCSNDYLGIAHANLLAMAEHAGSGSTGSRLLAGNSALAEATEQIIASFHDSEASLLFNSGYDANVGLLSCVPQRGDVVLYDALAHASIRDGIQLSLAKAYSFAHNNMEQLVAKIQQVQRQPYQHLFIVTESVFSMDGDACPIEALVDICQTYGAHLIVDEAHATGIIGKLGEGLVQAKGLHHQVFARVHTFGKACGCHGAAITGSKRLQQYLINFARSFIYSTALSPHAVNTIQASYRIFPQLHQQRRHLEQLIAHFQQSTLPFYKLPSQTPIQIVVIPGNDAVKKMAQTLQQAGLDVRPILSPTVPAGSERLRIVLHAYNTNAQLSQLIHLLQKQTL